MMKKVNNLSSSESSPIENLSKIVSGISSWEILYYTVKSNLSTILDTEFLDKLESLINENMLDYKNLYALLKATILNFKDYKKETENKLVNVLGLQANMEFNEIIKFLKEYLDVKLIESLNLEIENDNLKKEIEALQKRNKVLNFVLENILSQLEKLKEFGIDSVEDLKNKIIDLDKKVNKLEKFVNYLKDKKILLPTSGGRLRINPFIMNYLKTLDENLISPYSKKPVFYLNSNFFNNLIKPTNSKYKIKKFSPKSLDGNEEKNNPNNSDLEFPLMEKEFLIEEKFILEKEVKTLREDNKKLKESNKKLLEENEKLYNENKNLEQKNQELKQANQELKEQLELLQQKLKAYETPLDMKA